jgi:Zn finger protein HypA/HybF involved in hydrogenase expression
MLLGSFRNGVRNTVRWCNQCNTAPEEEYRFESCPDCKNKNYEKWWNVMDVEKIKNVGLNKKLNVILVVI